MSEDRYELFEEYRPLVYRVIKDLGLKSRDEIEQAGLLGLWTAVLKRDPKYGKRFFSYARKYIWGHIMQELKRQSRARTVSMYDFEGNIRFEKPVEYDIALYLELLETYNLSDFREYIEGLPERESIDSHQITFEFE